MTHRELIVEVSADCAEALSDALLELGAASISVEDADADTPAEQPLFGEPGLTPEREAWQRSRVVALIVDATIEPEALIEHAALAVGIAPPVFTLRDVVEQDWVRLTQSQFEPMAIGRRIWVVPSWHAAPDPDALILELDPGLAFGTGSHPTTRLCLEWLEMHTQAGQSVLDYGCGSGILAILAAKCGAAPVIGVDIDAQAVDAARANAARNRVDATFTLPDALGPGRFDGVVANILSNPLKVLAQMLCSRVAPGGWLALSGVLERQADEVAQAYHPWIDLSVWRAHEGWVCLAGRPSELS